MPVVMAQNRNIRSRGLLTAVRYRTMDRAPTMPRESMMLELMVTMITAVRMVITTREMLKEWSYTTPIKHFRYTRKIPSPSSRDMAKVSTGSRDRWRLGTSPETIF